MSGSSVLVLPLAPNNRCSAFCSNNRCFAARAPRSRSVPSRCCRTGCVAPTNLLCADACAACRTGGAAATPLLLACFFWQEGGLCLTRKGAEVGLHVCAFAGGSVEHERQRWQVDTVESYAARKASAQTYMKRFDFNEEASKQIGIRRERPDLQHEHCKNHAYGERFGVKLRPTAVIFCFVNEEWFALLRSVHSVIDGSPPELLQASSRWVAGLRGWRATIALPSSPPACLPPRPAQQHRHQHVQTQQSQR